MRLSWNKTHMVGIEQSTTFCFLGEGDVKHQITYFRQLIYHSNGMSLSGFRGLPKVLELNPSFAFMSAFIFDSKTISVGMFEDLTYLARRTSLSGGLPSIHSSR